MAAQVAEQRARLNALKTRAKRAAEENHIPGLHELAHAENALDRLSTKLRKLAGGGLRALGEVKGGVEKAVGDIKQSTKRARQRLGAGILAAQSVEGNGHSAGKRRARTGKARTPRRPAPVAARKRRPAK